jgi:hypothetical protein
MYPPHHIIWIGIIRDTAQALRMREIAAKTLQGPLVPEIGVRPCMLPREVVMIKDKGFLTLPGFVRPSAFEVCVGGCSGFRILWVLG